VSDFDIIIVAGRLFEELGIVLVVRIKLRLVTHGGNETFTVIPESLISANIVLTVLEGSFPVALEQVRMVNFIVSA